MPKRKEHSFHNGLEQKYCNKCSTWKNLDLFYFDKCKWDKVASRCKSCDNNRGRKRRANFTTEQRKTHLEQQRNQMKKYRASGRRNYLRNLRRKNDPKYAMLKRLRDRLSQALKRKGIRKTKSTMNLCGCSLDELKAHLEKQFVENMSWENRSSWHIDHIRPCASFDLTEIEQQKQCFHFTNLQPLWAADNFKKGAKWNIIT